MDMKLVSINYLENHVLLYQEMYVYIDIHFFLILKSLGKPVIVFISQH